MLKQNKIQYMVKELRVVFKEYLNVEKQDGIDWNNKKSTKFK